MPMVGGKKFPYTDKGKEDAASELKKMSKSAGKKKEKGQDPMTQGYKRKALVEMKDNIGKMKKQALKDKLSRMKKSANY